MMFTPKEFNVHSPVSEAQPGDEDTLVITTL